MHRRNRRVHMQHNWVRGSLSVIVSQIHNTDTEIRLYESHQFQNTRCMLRLFTFTEHFNSWILITNHTRTGQPVYRCDTWLTCMVYCPHVLTNLINGNFPRFPWNTAGLYLIDMFLDGMQTATVLNSLRSSGAYMRQYTNQHWFR